MAARRGHPLSGREYHSQDHRPGPPQAESQVFAAITQQLSTTQAQALEELLHREQGRRGSTFAWLKEPAVKASPASIKVLISKLETVRALQVSRIDVSRLNRMRVASVSS